MFRDSRPIDVLFFLPSYSISKIPFCFSDAGQFRSASFFLGTLILWISLRRMPTGSAHFSVWSGSRRIRSEIVFENNTFPSDDEGLDPRCPVISGIRYQNDKASFPAGRRFGI